MAGHPCVFIGLGGAGCLTVANVKRLLLKAMGPDDLNKFCKFLMFDTNDAEYDGLSREFYQEFKVNPHFIEKHVEWFPIGGFNPFEYAMDMLNSTTPDARDIQAWLDRQGAQIFPSKLADDGAGGYRQRGRLSFALNYGTFEHEIEAATKQLNDLRDTGITSEAVNYWVVTGSCGGTGSSCFYDVLYLIAKIHDKIAASAPKLRPIIYSPNPFIDIVKARNEEELERRYTANGYAFFLELQSAISRYRAGGEGAGEEAAVEMALPSRINDNFKKKNWKPFGNAMIVDTACEDAVSFIPFSQLYSVTAEMIAYNILTGADKKLDEWWDNPTPQKDPDTGTWQHWNASGFRAVEYPARPLADYSAACYFSELIKSYSSPTKKVTEAVQRGRANDLLERLILEPFGPSKVDRPKAASASAQSFRSLADGQYLSPRTRRWGSIDEFCKTNDGKPDAAPVIDPSALTADSLRSSMERLIDDIKLMKSDIRKDFIGRFGAPLNPGQGDYYVTLQRRLWDELEAHLEKEGICTLIGPPENLDSGVILRLISLVNARRNELQSALEASNKRVDELRAGARGLDRLKAELAEEAEKQGGISSVFRSGKALRERLDLFAQQRRELVDEAFNNQLLMLEIELLNYVGSPDSPVRYAEWFTSQRDNVTSLLVRTKNQAVRIRSWLGHAANNADTRLKKEVSDLQLLDRGVITRFMPGIDTIELNGVRGPLAEETIKHLQSLDNAIGHRLRTFTALAGSRTLSWSEIRQEDSDQSPEARVQFWDGAREWVRKQFDTDPTLRDKVSLDLASYVGADDEKRMQIKEKLSADKVLVFSKLRPEVRKKSPAYRLVVTATPINHPFTNKAVSVGTNDSFLQDQRAPWRAVVVKYYTNLCLEKAFPMFDSLEPVYQKYTDYEPHIWKDGRSRFQKGKRAAWEYAFSLGLAWAWILGQNKWKSDPKIRRLFTKLLDYQEGSFLSGGPIKIDSRAYYLLDVELKDSMINREGELECSLAGSSYSKCGSVTDAWQTFLKSQKSFANMTFFQQTLGGVRFDWSESTQEAIVQVITQERAGAFTEYLAKFRAVLDEKIAELKRQVKRTTAEEADMQTFGMVMNCIIKIERQIKASLAGDGSQTL